MVNIPEGVEAKVNELRPDPLYDTALGLLTRMSNSPHKQEAKWWHIALVLALLPLLLVFLILAIVFITVSSISLRIVIWFWWCLRGRDILFVYSNSPIWHDYIEQHVLPYLGDRAVVLNWSERKRWSLSLARLAFHHFGGYRQFNPLAVVFRPFGRTRTFRFWQPFRDFKHGNPEALQKVEAEFFGFIGVQRHESSA